MEIQNLIAQRSSTKGQAASNLKTILVKLAMLIVLLTLLISIGALIKNSSNNASCKLSIKAHAFTGTDINCPTKEVTINTNKATKAKKQIAEELVTCWQNYGEGKLNLFDSETKQFCEVCTVINLEGPDVQNLFKYLYTNRAKIDGKSQYYMDYLTNGISNKEVILTDKLSSNKKQAIIFTYFKNSKEILQFASKAGIATGTGVAVGGIVLMFTPVGWIGAATVGGAALTGTAIISDTSFIQKNIIDKVITPDTVPGLVIRPYDENALTNLGCEVLSAQQS